MVKWRAIKSRHLIKIILQESVPFRKLGHIHVNIHAYMYISRFHIVWRAAWRRGISPFSRAKFISTCNKSHLSYKHSGAPKAIRNESKSIKFPGVAPQHSKEQCTSHDRLFPLTNKNSYIKPCILYSASHLIVQCRGWISASVYTCVYIYIYIFCLQLTQQYRRLGNFRW